MRWGSLRAETGSSSRHTQPVCLQVPVPQSWVWWGGHSAGVECPATAAVLVLCYQSVTMLGCRWEWRLTGVTGVICQASPLGCSQAGFPQIALGADSCKKPRNCSSEVYQEATLTIAGAPPQPSALRAVPWLHCKPATTFTAVRTIKVRRKTNSCAALVMQTADTSSV